MDEKSDVARWAAISTLQERRDRYQPDSDSALIADRAIDLALGERRSVSSPEHLIGDLWCNSAYTTYRSKDRGRKALARYASTRMRVVTTEDGIDIADPMSAEDHVLAQNSEFCATALRRSPVIGDFGPAFVARLMAGDTVAEAAAACGISRASGYRAITRLRAELVEARAMTEVA